MYALILPNNGLGYILGDFFANSSGRPAHARNLLCNNVWGELQYFEGSQKSQKRCKTFSLKILLIHQTSSLLCLLLGKSGL
jgi:hypothetical protein